MTVVPPAHLRLAATENAIRSPLPDHTRLAIIIGSYGRDIITDGDKWFLDCCQRLVTLSESRWARLREIEAKVERSRK